MRLLVPIALSVLVVTAVLLVSPNFRPERGPDAIPYAGDFLHEWIGGYVIRAGDPARLYDREYTTALQHDPSLVGFEFRRDAYLPMVYPPFYYVLVSPLSALPFRVGAGVWVAFSLACLVTSLGLLGIAVRPGGSLDVLGGETDASLATMWALVRRWAIPAAFAFGPVIENLVSSQKGAVPLLVLTVTFLLMRRGDRFAAGLVFGLQAFKPQLAIVIPIAMLAKREWRFVAGSGSSMLGLAGLSLAVGLVPCADYLRFVTGVADYVGAQPAYLHREQCLYGFFTLLAGGPTTAARIATVVAGAVTVYLLVRLLAGPLETDQPRFLAQFAGLVLATALLSPHVLTYDLTMLLLPLWLTTILLFRGFFDSSLRRAAFWLVVALYAGCALSPMVAERTGIPFSVPVMMALLALLSRFHLQRVGGNTSEPSGDQRRVEIKVGAAGASHLPVSARRQSISSESPSVTSRWRSRLTRSPV